MWLKKFQFKSQVGSSEPRLSQLSHIVWTDFLTLCHTRRRIQSSYQCSYLRQLVRRPDSGLRAHSRTEVLWGLACNVHNYCGCSKSYSDTQKCRLLFQQPEHPFYVLYRSHKPTLSLETVLRSLIRISNCFFESDLNRRKPGKRPIFCWQLNTETSDRNHRPLQKRHDFGVWSLCLPLYPSV